MTTSRRMQHTAIVGLGLLFAYSLGPALVGGAGYTAISLLLLGIGATLVVFRPRWGVYLTLLVSPLRAFGFGSGLLSLTRIAALWTVLAMLIHFTIRRKDFRRTGIEGPVFLMALGMSLSFFRTPNTNLITMHIFSLLSLYGLVLLIVNLVEDEAQLKELTLVFLASAIYPLSLAITQWVQSPDRSVLGYFRISGTSTSPSGLGGLFVPIVFVAFSLIFYPRFSRPLRWLIVGIFAGGIVALILSFSRSNWIGLLMGFGMLFLTPLFGQLARGRRLAAVLLVAFLAVAVWGFWPWIEARFVTPVADILTTGTSADSILVRRYEWLAGPRIILNKYFLGTGIGNYDTAVLEFRQIYNTWIPGVPHNLIFYFFGEVGIVGAAGFIWLVAWLYRRARSHYCHIIAVAPSLAFYAYVGTLMSLVAYVGHTLFLGGFFVNELWISFALLIVATRIAQEMKPVSSLSSSQPSMAFPERTS